MCQNLFPCISTSILAVTMIKSSLSIHIFVYYNFFFIARFVDISLEVTFQISLVVLQLTMMCQYVKLEAFGDE